MNIALIAHDAKKELMVQFCIAYCGILSRHNLCATGTTGKLVSRPPASRLPALWPAARAAIKAISSRISCNEIDLLLYFRNPIGAKATEPDEASLLRLCDVYNIPYATNIASAEAMIHALENGDLDWRDIVNPKKSKNRFFHSPIPPWNGGFCFRGVMGRSPRRRSRRCGQKAAGTALWRFGAPRTCLQLGLLFPKPVLK